MGEIRLNGSGAIWEGGTNGEGYVGLVDAAGNPLTKTRNAVAAATDQFLPTAGLNDGTFRPQRVDRFGGTAIARYTTVSQLAFFTAALPPTWLAPVATHTITYSLSSGARLNAGASVAANGNAALIGMTPIFKADKNPLQYRWRARVESKGGNNAQFEIGLGSTQAPASAALPFGFSWTYLADGALKPCLWVGGVTVASGDPIQSLIEIDRYYVWDVLVDDDAVTFVVQDPSTGLIVDEQTLSGQALDWIIGQQKYWFPFARTFVGGVAGTGAASQLFVASGWGGVLDNDTYMPFAEQQVAIGMGLVVNPTLALTQLENYANSAAPASATLSNTAVGYSNLGGQFQFVATAGAETDYALFGIAVPAGLQLIVKGVHIDTFNMGAISAGTPTQLQWFLGVDSLAATLATNTFRKALGTQTIPVGTAIGGSADRSIDSRFGSGYAVNPGRFVHIGLKMPVGTATASQIIRGVVSVDGHFK